jgi:hypothetical protein
LRVENVEVRRGDLGLTEMRWRWRSLCFSRKPIDTLNSIDNLTAPEQHKLFLALLRRVSPVEINELIDDELILCAESIFLELDNLENEQHRNWSILISN